MPYKFLNCKKIFDFKDIKDIFIVSCIMYIALGIGIALIVIIYRLIVRICLYRENFVFSYGIYVIEFLFFSVVFIFWVYLLKIYSISKTFVVMISTFVVATFPTFDYVVRPVLFLLNHKRLRQPHKGLQSWIDEITGQRVRVYILDCALYNAYATGVLPFARIILIGRPLLEKMSPQELKAIVAHEVGHLLLKHTFVSYVVSVICVIMFSLTNMHVYRIANNYSFPLDIIIVGISGAASGALLLGIIPGFVQKKLEFIADLYAAKIVGRKNVENALLRLDFLTKGKVSRGALTHPSLNRRLMNLFHNAE